LNAVGYVISAGLLHVMLGIALVRLISSAIAPQGFEALGVKVADDCATGFIVVSNVPPPLSSVGVLLRSRNPLGSAIVPFKPCTPIATISPFFEFGVPSVTTSEAELVPLP